MTEQDADAASSVVDYASCYAKLVAEVAPPETDHREPKRYSFVTSLRMQRVDDNLVPLGEPFDAASRDISLWGLGIVVEPETPKGNYAIRFTHNNKEYRLLARMLWCRPIENEPFRYAGLHVLNLAIDHTEAN